MIYVVSNQTSFFSKFQRISVDEFNCFFNEMINRLSETIPHVLRILLKLFHVSIIKYFSVNENDYNTLYTALFF